MDLAPTALSVSAQVAPPPPLPTNIRGYALPRRNLICKATQILLRQSPSATSSDPFSDLSDYLSSLSLHLTLFEALEISKSLNYPDLAIRFFWFCPSLSLNFHHDPFTCNCLLLILSKSTSPARFDPARSMLRDMDRSNIRGNISTVNILLGLSATLKTCRRVLESEENKGKMKYLLGESMGGAVALLVHRKKPEFWDGAVLVAPMCKIADELRPPRFVISFLQFLCKFIPTWKITPTKDMIDLGCKVPEIREQIRENRYCYKGRLRLQTGYELLRVSSDLEQRLKDVTLPFLVLHGEDDKVTDKSVSEKLHDVAYSQDKTLKMYPNMWHSLLYGETPENIEIVLSDIICWLEERSAFGNQRLEGELKRGNDDLSK